MHAPVLDEPLRAFRDAIGYLAEGRDAVERAIGLVEREAPGADGMLARGLAIASTLATLQLDASALQAAIVRPACEDGLPLERVAEVAGAEVARLVTGVQRLEHIRWDHLEQEATENLRKMFLAIASDIRVVLLALAERVHVLRGLDARPEPERRGIARETMEVYAPLANRLGIWQMKWEFEDLAFRALEPQTYREIKALLADKRTARTAAIEQVITLLRERVGELGIDARVSGRPKHIYSIYKKMQRKRLGYEQIYDVSAVRVIVDRIEDCYGVLGMVHGLWTPIAGEFDDYIARPKGNDYRSLHTAVVGPDGKPLEVQIRTQEMHEYNEYGVAAHWRYKEGASRADKRFDAKINLLRQLMAWQREVTVAPEHNDDGELANAMRSELFTDQVYVFTPGGEVVDLPQGATPVDFAYRIHTDVGHRCRGAKVNGQIVTLDYRLQTGERVEIITAKQPKPSRDWINPQLGFVHTSSARQKIKAYFRAQQRDAAIAQGREVVERELERLGIASRGVESILSFYPRYAALDDLLAAIGFGDVVPQSIGTRLLEWIELERAATQPVPQTTAPIEPAAKRAAQVSIAGVEDVMSHPARCCNPVPGDDVVGYITRGRGLAIHRVDCSNARTDHEPERWMPLSWGARRNQTYPVAVRIVADDRAGMLRDVLDIVAQEGVNIANTAAVKSPREQTSTITLQLEIRSAEQVVRIMNRIERAAGIRSVRRVSV
ncbi:MAG: bifunctional (p)ppGpp synthetase/guanosine-3',5'-bis(diphosphate) 3'-pyrophosphohydrolase [Deltaproteobacteria bacterium]|nr:bifunctional (p)ppGpp synthetase/guanosine-3',5'-bis(diphosphate) 3'-pyrophosphohydrolase [Deltaproteobacteria bacterium]MBP7285571.1 bifunctional (p)ppGpp synthetase/guanosine-3',5'-bis(diphosphate) 3'-pyrophosphohydrolase [Nannocystaceae bacterium]